MTAIHSARFHTTVILKKDIPKLKFILAEAKLIEFLNFTF